VRDGAQPEAQPGAELRRTGLGTAARLDERAGGSAHSAGSAQHAGRDRRGAVPDLGIDPGQPAISRHALSQIGDVIWLTFISGQALIATGMSEEEQKQSTENKRSSCFVLGTLF
jgi:hypothetical protein